MMQTLLDWTERGWVPDSLVRLGIRRLLNKRLQQVDQGSPEKNQQRLEALLKEFADAPLALVPEKANEQHYEVPAELFKLTLGPRLKYSSCLWPAGCESLAEAEDHALSETCQHAQLEDGQRILELGCGWGSLSLWMAVKYPKARITAVSNSASQREFILRRAAELGANGNLEVITCDINDFETDQQFDRVVSVEMFEHVRNHALLFEKISRWLNSDGKLFTHVFCHRQWTYKFEDESRSDWMSRYFFSGGIMPGADLFSNFQQHLSLDQQWSWNGQHYQKTCEAWLANMDRNRDAIMHVLRDTYGNDQAARWFQRWRMFYLACSELFGYRGGEEWFVSHYLFENQATTAGNPGTRQRELVPND